MAKKTLQFEVHAKGEMPRLLKCPDGEMFIDTDQGIYAFIPKGETKEEKHASAQHFSKMMILGGMMLPKFAKICKIVENFNEIPANEITIVEKDGERFASFNLSAGGTLELAVEGDTADLYVDNQSKAFYVCEKHKGTFLARIEGERFVKDLGEKADNGDEEAKLTLELMREYVCLRDEDICW